MGAEAARISSRLYDQENKSKLREDTVIDLTRQQEIRPEVGHAFQQWLTTKPVTAEHVEQFKQQAGEIVRKELGVKRFHFPQSKARYAANLQKVLNEFTAKATDAAYKGGIKVVEKAARGFVNKLMLRVAAQPHTTTAALAQMDEYYNDYSASLGPESAKAKLAAAGEVARVGHQAYLDKRMFDAAAHLRNLMTDKVDLKTLSGIIADADDAVAHAKKEDREFDLNQAKERRNVAVARKAAAETDLLELEHAVKTGKTSPGPEAQARIKELKARTKRSEHAMVIADKRLVIAQDQLNFQRGKEVRQAKAAADKLKPKTRQVLNKHGDAVARGAYTREMAEELVEQATIYARVEQRPHKGLLPTMPAGYQKIFDDLGINFHQHIRGGEEAARDLETALARIPDDRGVTKTVAANVEQSALDNAQPQGAGCGGSGVLKV